MTVWNKGNSMGNKKVFIFFLVFLISFSFVFAGDFERVKQGEVINLTQTCGNCSYMNLSYIKYISTGKFILGPGEYIMNNADNVYYYEFNGTTDLGIHEWCFHGDPSSGEDVPACLKFEVTRQGFEINEAEGVIYSISLVVVLILFLITLYYGLAIPWKDYRSPDGNILAIDYKKYLKLGLIFISYLMLTFLFGIGKGMAYSFLQSNEAYNFFNVGFSILLIGIMPSLIATSYFVIASALFDKKVQRAIERGLPVR
jgi:hypothetical protein